MRHLTRRTNPLALTISAFALMMAVAGCAAEDATTAPVAPEVTEVRVLPDSLGANVGARIQFSADVRDNRGQSMQSERVTWSSSSPTVASVDTLGSVTLLSVGTAEIRATARGKTGRGKVTANPSVLQSISLTPATVSLAAGATQQFAATGTWSDGANTVPSVTYSATGGTITAGGLYTAGAAGGLYRVIAVQQNGTIADTSAITVVAVTPPPPPPPPAGLVNECSAPEAGWIWCDDFDVNRLASYFEVETAGGNFARVNGVGNEGSYGMRTRWAVGGVDGGALHLAIGRTPQAYFRPADAGTANYREIYWRVYVRNQDGWVGSGSGKLSRAMIFASSSSWAQAMISHVWSGDDNTQYQHILMLDPARGTDAAGNLVTTRYNDFANLTWLGMSRGTNAIFTAPKVGSWHCVEAHVRLNDAGQSNGVNELWVDGTLDASRTGLNWVGSYNAYGINAVFLENWWNQGSPAAQERYMDNFVVSTQRIGC